MKTQYEKILKHLQNGETMSVPQAMLQFGQVSLAVAVYKLRQQGYDIETTFTKAVTGKTYAVYSLKKGKKK